MRPVEYSGIVVDRCERCRGLWFDGHERADLLALPGSEAVDEGPNSASRRVLALEQIDCLRCKVRMVRMVDPRHPEVHYEQCADCGGSFLDAGEFRALKKQGLAALLADLFLGRRRR